MKTEVYPYFISQEAVEGNLYAVYYVVPDNFTTKVTEKDYIAIDVPVGYAKTTITATYIPIDAVYQTTDVAYLFTNEKGIAKNRKVTLGNVYGGFVEVKKGLRDGDQIVLTRNVLDGDRITASE
jgi:multidrug efflux pump subunit AcrA (membrane-fusion protein)